MENGTKKTIIWESNSEPPKNYIWAKPDGSMVEYNENTKSWNNSTSISDSGSTSNNFTITTIPESNGAFEFVSTPNSIYELVADQFTSEDFTGNNDLPDAFGTEDTVEPYILLANERLIQKLGLTKEQFIALNNEGSRITVQGRSEQMNEWAWITKQKAPAPSLPGLPPLSVLNYECEFGDFQNQNFYIHWECSIDGTKVYIDSLDFYWDPIVDVDISNPTTAMSFNLGTTTNERINIDCDDNEGQVVILTVTPSDSSDQSILRFITSNNYFEAEDVSNNYPGLSEGQHAIRIYAVTRFNNNEQLTAVIGEIEATCYLSFGYQK